MKSIFFFAVMLFASNCIAQNLVPNPSFEEYDTCQTTLGQVYKAVDWFAATESPDYFNSCTWIPEISVPFNLLGYQPAATGKAYCGLVSYHEIPDTREYIGTHLIDQLSIGQKYFVSFYLSLAGRTLNFDLGINKMGCKLSTMQYSFNALQPNNEATFYTDSIITDTINWVQISGSFIADSAYQFIAFGNFFDDANTDTLGSIFQSTYYYIDDVCLSTDSLSCARPVNVDEIATSTTLIAFPNPFNRTLTLSGNLKIDEIIIFNVIGIEVYRISTIQLPQNNFQINTENWMSGIYFLQTTTDSKIQTIKIFKQ